MSNFYDQSKINRNRNLLLSNPKFEEINSGESLNLFKQAQTSTKESKSFISVIVKFFKNKPDIEEEEIELILGLDFGTSSTKIIIRET